MSVCMFDIHFVCFKSGSAKLCRMEKFHQDQLIYSMFGVKFIRIDAPSFIRFVELSKTTSCLGEGGPIGLKSYASMLG